MTVDRDWYRGGRSILERIGIGDLVEFLGEDGVCQGGLARYAGYVASMSNQTIGISTMHPYNEFSHKTGREIRATKIKEVQIGSISHYRIVRKNGEPIDTRNTPRA